MLKFQGERSSRLNRAMTLIALCGALSSVTQIAHAQTSPLARDLAGSASRTEVRSAASDRVSVRRTVEPALQSVIISAGQSPLQVQMALKLVLKTCHVTNAAGMKINDLSCPGLQGSYDALQDLLSTVTALIDQQSQPTGGDVGHGTAAFGGVGAIGAGGGPDYRQPG